MIKELLSLKHVKKQEYVCSADTKICFIPCGVADMKLFGWIQGHRENYGLWYCGVQGFAWAQCFLYSDEKTLLQHHTAATEWHSWASDWGHVQALYIT